MADSSLILGEFRRTVDDRFRLSVPQELIEPLDPIDNQLMMVKERPGCVSLWNHQIWQAKLETDIGIVASKLKANRMIARQGELQQLGRLLSTRHRPVPLAGRSRLVIPDGFREFLMIEPSTDVLVVGAAICIEIWQIAAWRECLNEQIPRFGELLQRLAE
jgi:MraZ protein